MSYPEVVPHRVTPLYGALLAALRVTIASASSSRHIRGDRKRLAEVNLKPFSDRASVLVAVAFRADSSKLLYSTRQERREPLRIFLKHTRELESLDDLPSWKDQEDALAWARRVADLRRNGRGPTFRAHRHLLDSGLRTQSAVEVLKEPRAYPPELVSRAVMEVKRRRYRPKTLATVSAEQDWVFD